MSSKKLPYSFAFYPDTKGGHTHVRIFAGGTGCIRGKAGDLCFQSDEWENLKRGLVTLSSSDREIIIREDEGLKEEDKENA